MLAISELQINIELNRNLTSHFYILLILLLLSRSYVAHNYHRLKYGKQKVNIRQHFTDDNRLLFFMFNLKIIINKENNLKINNLKIISNILTISCWIIVCTSLIESIESIFGLKIIF
jgi:hypothetical protein